MRIIVTALGIAALALGATAEAARPANLRQLNQERRIDAGVRSGKLTRAEANRLKAEQRSIAQLRVTRKARHGGQLTSADKRTIERRQEAANAHILGQKNDGQRGKNHLKI